MMLTLTKMGLLDTLGMVLTALGRFEEGEDVFASALDTGKPLGGLMDGSVLTHLGVLRREQWRLDEARDAGKLRIRAGAGRRGNERRYTDRSLHGPYRERGRVMKAWIRKAASCHSWFLRYRRF